MELLICEKLKYTHLEKKSSKIHFDNKAAIIAFAQGEIISSFIEGIHPSYNQTLHKFMDELLVKKYPKILGETLEELSEESKQELLENLKTVGEAKLSEFWNGIAEYAHKNHIKPILDAVEVLPKDELAAMAESLVNITSIKRRISMETETVGGPIDVAVISKKDGFIWIKRKHYFDPKYNQHFFKR